MGNSIFEYQTYNMFEAAYYLLEGFNCKFEIINICKKKNSISFNFSDTTNKLKIYKQNFKTQSANVNLSQYLDKISFLKNEITKINNTINN